MNKKDLQKRAGILTENYSLRSSGAAAFCMKDDLIWETDGIPPAPSNAERAQVDAGKIDAEILGLKRRAGLIEDETVTECPGTDSSVASAMEKVRSVMAQLKIMMQGGRPRANAQAMFYRLEAAMKDLESASQECEAAHAEEQY